MPSLAVVGFHHPDSLGAQATPLLHSYLISISQWKIVVKDMVPFTHACKNLLICYNNQREILDVWSRQLSPLVIYSQRRGCYNRNGLFLFYKLITYIQE